VPHKFVCTQKIEKIHLHTFCSNSVVSIPITSLSGSGTHYHEPQICEHAFWPLLGSSKILHIDLKKRPELNTEALLLTTPGATDQRGSAISLINLQNRRKMDQDRPNFVSARYFLPCIVNIYKPGKSHNKSEFNNLWFVHC
jgi:hypothetical protein